MDTNTLKTTAVVILLFAIISIISTCEGPNRTPQMVFTDPQYHFRIACSNSSWILTDKTGIKEVLVIAKPESEGEEFIPNLTIVAEKLPFMITAKEYGEKNRKAMAEKGLEIISGRITLINNLAFYDLEYIFQTHEPPLRYRSLCLIRDEVAFIITVTVPGNKYAQYMEDFNSIINTFKFI